MDFERIDKGFISTEEQDKLFNQTMENKISSGFFSNQNVVNVLKPNAPISSQRAASFWDNETTPSQLCEPESADKPDQKNNIE